MNKKLLMVLVIGGVLFYFCAGQCYAGPVVTAKAAAAEDQARTALKTKEWMIYLTPEGGRGGVESDVITFTDEGKVSSRNLLAKGYGDSNFRVNIESDGTAVWETMKVDKDKNLAFFRGELLGSGMRGTIFMKSARGVTETYYFSTASAPVAPVIFEMPAAAKKGKK